MKNPTRREMLEMAAAVAALPLTNSVPALSSEARSAKEEHANLVRSCISGPVFDGAELVWE